MSPSGLPGPVPHLLAELLREEGGRGVPPNSGGVGWGCDRSGRWVINRSPPPSSSSASRPAARRHDPAAAPDLRARRRARGSEKFGGAAAQRHVSCCSAAAFRKVRRVAGRVHARPSRRAGWKCVFCLFGRRSRNGRSVLRDCRCRAVTQRTRACLDPVVCCPN